MARVPLDFEALGFSLLILYINLVLFHPLRKGSNSYKKSIKAYNFRIKSGICKMPMLINTEYIYIARR